MGSVRIQLAQRAFNSHQRAPRQKLTTSGSFQQIRRTKLLHNQSRTNASIQSSQVSSASSNSFKSNSSKTTCAQFMIKEIISTVCRTMSRVLGIRSLQWVELQLGVEIYSRSHRLPHMQTRLSCSRQVRNPGPAISLKSSVWYPLEAAPTIT